MKTEQIRVATEVKSNIEVGSILVREVDTTYKYRVVYITVDHKAILVSKHQSNETAIIDLLCISGWLKVIESVN
ncbi:hypothetical protein [bacterium endosymbiont of Bathymodiolus sp. 5 South]|uniref:hypothetical protein n=1 Tax=bacterium endosymbiont of Bathymodiolus sp. 5 South TaxID=1181670 RepID=UPI0010B1468E|nr:hypothetical protein [bacterium endosymbiont of Bathymodiolus sp. 5 South]SSC08519.1 hypothetical protein BTURTLESOX_429 [bacterium endosymbiont of Bathymodiolus sp. 5 South]